MGVSFVGSVCDLCSVVVIAVLYSISWYIPGPDAYFVPSLTVGQPSNNMDLSEIKLYLGIMIKLSFFAFVMKNNKSGTTLIICMLIFYCRIALSEAHCHIIYIFFLFFWQSGVISTHMSHVSTCNISFVFFSVEVVLFIPVHCYVTGIRTTFQKIKKYEN